MSLLDNLEEVTKDVGRSRAYHPTVCLGFVCVGVGQEMV